MGMIVIQTKKIENPSCPKCDHPLQENLYKFFNIIEKFDLKKEAESLKLKLQKAKIIKEENKLNEKACGCCTLNFKTKGKTLDCGHASCEFCYSKNYRCAICNQSEFKKERSLMIPSAWNWTKEKCSSCKLDEMCIRKYCCFLCNYFYCSFCIKL
jgi:hypothetical protein